MPTRSLNAETSVLWMRVSGLAALHGAITMTWIVYNTYLPELLAQFGFPLTLAQSILVVENLLAAAIEPTMGALSDRTSGRANGLFSFISRRVIVAAAIFVLIPLLAFAGTPGDMVRWILPFLLIVWALAMATFRSPSLSLLKKCASDQNLPRAAAVITIITGLFAAIRPFVTASILSWGPMAAFAIGSGGLLLGTWVLRRLYARAEPDPPRSVEREEPLAPGSTSGGAIASDLRTYMLTLALVFGVGLSGAWSFRFSIVTVSKLLAMQFPGVNITWMISLFFFSLACAALPLGVVAAKVGNQRVMLIGAATAALGVGALGVGTAEWWPTTVLWPLIIVLVVVGVSVITTGAVPFALSVMPERWAGLGVGMYFGGFTFGTGLFQGAFAHLLGSASLASVALLTAGSFLISCMFLASSLGIVPPQPSTQRSALM